MMKRIGTRTVHLMTDAKGSRETVEEQLEAQLSGDVVAVLVFGQSNGKLGDWQCTSMHHDLYESEPDRP